MLETDEIKQTLAEWRGIRLSAIVCIKEVNTMAFEKKKGGCKGK